ncbi:heat shock protein transcriptional repressor HspR [Arcobacter porcinus]|uniref:Heat shock protein HspR n=1 Tax=Arcobacter porcinus TaxID=1935204 RepID=A0A1C0AUZ6_9BACT|nr:helix-turn-helix transcriptional regulator [Arcobacter porcinus]OCL94247.1 putative heat shock protein HspR [Aliarcobacter thereius]OCL81949.1 putative heat shock protein HspR [Arcobacter porcinus]OCL82025.1 putative heat shock protein HspR [Arcobacter porcinus]OCL86204.1 putative heat shock protein HspR [Arcobacter porcinus]OCL90343.1 putative heat shock protein HspR [Arcobacter porcinus]
MQSNSYIEPVYLISAVAEILNIHPQTLRQYEREGLIKPSRSNGKIRLYSQKDINHIKYVLTLTRDLGVNLAGVDIVLQLNQKIEDLENEIDSLKIKLQSKSSNSVVPDNKALVIQKSSLEVVIVKK